MPGRSKCGGVFRQWQGLWLRRLTGFGDGCGFGADLAMYRAKRAGRSRFPVYDTQLGVRVTIQLELAQAGLRTIAS